MFVCYIDGKRHNGLQKHREREGEVQQVLNGNVRMVAAASVRSTVFLRGKEFAPHPEMIVAKKSNNTKTV